MENMFWNCESLIKVDLSSFNTQNVTTMENMFWNCKSLIKIDLSSFNTQNVAFMRNIVRDCETLIKIRRENLYKINNDLKIRIFKLNIIEI